MNGNLLAKIDTLTPIEAYIMQLLLLTKYYLTYGRNRPKNFICHWYHVADIGFFSLQAA
jgi:hypothetical protein